MRSYVMRIGFALLIILSLLVVMLPMSLAQDNCGSGVPPRLIVGGQGQVIPGQSSNRVRDVPGGSQVGSITSGEIFSVLAGPQCLDGISWWQISSGSVTGWTAEGVDGQAFLEPVVNAQGGGGGGSEGFGENLYGPLVNRDPDCSGVTSAHEVGMMVELNMPFQQIEEFYGHPLIEDTLYSFPPQSQGDYIDMSLFSEDMLSAATFFIQSGPVCFNGAYLWNITLDKFGDTNRASEWVYETVNGQVQLIPAAVQPEVNSAFEPTRVSLSRNTAPIIDITTQLGYGMGGGCESYGCNSGGVWYPAQGFQQCLVGWFVTTVIYYEPQCMYVYPFDVGEQVEVTIRRPDGTIYTQSVQAAEAVSYALKTNIIDMYSDDDLRVVQVGVVRIEINHQLGDPNGVWMVEARGSSHVVQQAYLLDIGDYFSARMDLQCEGPSPAVIFNGFEPFSEHVLVYAERLGPTTNTDSEFVFDYQEADRWTLQADAHGMLIAVPDFPMTTGVLALDGLDGWEANVSLRNSTPLDALTPKICPSFYALPDALSQPIYYNKVITGSFDDRLWNGLVESHELFPNVYYVFDGHLGDIVSLEVLETRTDVLGDEREPLSLSIEVYTPDGTRIASGENAIPAFALPEDGLYTIMLAYYNQGQMEVSGYIPFNPQFTLVFEGESQSNGESTIAVDLTVDGQSAASLPDKRSWTFAGAVGQSITIDAASADFDIQLRLLNADGELLAEDDDSGDGMNARLTFTVPQTGIYTIEITSWNDKTGAYTVQLADEP